MKKILKISALFLALAMCLLLCISCTDAKDITTISKEINTAEGDESGYTVILHSNDVHGAVEGYAYIAELKKTYEQAGATVITIDDGDFSSGNIYVNISKGESAVSLMNLVGYDIVALGNHELDYGYENLKLNLEDANFQTICSNVSKDGETIFDSEIIVKVGKLKIGFFALLTPETKTKVNPGLISGLDFAEKDELYEIANKEVETLKKAGCDIIICLSHLGIYDESQGNRSIDIAANVSGIDMIIDGHSHTVMTEGENGEPIQSTGSEFENIGVIRIENSTKSIKDHKLVSTENLDTDADVLAAAENLIATVDEEFGRTFAVSKVYLEGSTAMVRTGETNLGDLIADAFIWSATNESTLKVDADHVVAVTNGGGIRASVEAGEISRSSIKTVLPFGNTIAVDYVKGSELLEALEAATCSTPGLIGGFPHISGMKIKIDTTIAYDQGEQYPGSTYYAPKSIKRVTILEINGQAFNPDDTYAVVTNNFMAAGGDQYYAFKRSYDEGNGFDTSIPLDEAVVNYIQYALGGIIDETYATPQGRIEIVK